VVQSAKDAIHMLGDTSKVFNSGTIDADNFGARFYGENAYLLNNGDISADNTAVTFGGTRSSLDNHGTIEGRVGVSVNAETGHFRLTNSGTIEGSKYAYVGNEVSEHIRNTGEFIGDVYLRSGWDTFISDGGTVTGRVFGGNGDDTFRVDTDTLRLVEREGGGSDSLFSSVTNALGDFFENLTLTGSDAIDGRGNALANVLTGNSAANTILGLRGRDTIDAGSGDDIVRGGAGNDHIDGGRGWDTINGARGADVIDGSVGRDSIFGGRGTDLLTGGAARDTFIFSNKHGSDTITDFAAKGAKHDILDLSRLTEIVGLRDLRLHHMEQVGDDVVITDGASHITLNHVDLADLTKSDFLF
jgi:Ca2+-binding RTX toxin-like protein